MLTHHAKGYELHLLQEYFALGSSLGSSRAVAAFRGVVAVGTSSGVVGVLMPRGLSADGHPSGQARVVQLGEARPEDNAVSSMAFSLQASHHHHTFYTLLMLSPVSRHLPVFSRALCGSYVRGHDSCLPLKQRHLHDHNADK